MTFNPYGQIHFSSRQDLKRIQAVVRSSFFIVFVQGNNIEGKYKTPFWFKQGFYIQPNNLL